MEAKEVLSRMTSNIVEYHKAKIKEKQEERRKVDIEIDVHRDALEQAEKAIRETQDILEHKEKDKGPDES